MNDWVLIGPESMAALDPDTRALLRDVVRRVESGWRVTALSSVSPTPGEQEDRIVWRR